jgi:serine/threonine protein kinase/Tol biopolymer transport system component
MTLSAGSKLGPYELHSPIGAGGMGEVWKAKDPRLGREVAIKVLPASFSADADRLRRFEQEARAAGILNHPNLTAVHDIGSDAQTGAPYVVQELLEGETLRSALSGGKLSIRRAIDYSLQIVGGLAAAHEKGIVHRDLKPENIFVTNDGRVKILDFGLAKLTQMEDKGQATNLPTEAAGTEPGVVLGTLGYMAPEQVRGKPADARSDIFSFGAILYEMLSGRRAFHGDSAADTMSAILKEDPPDLSVTNQSVPPGLDRIVRHCLEKSPERRFHSAHDIAFDLESLSSVSQPGAVQATALSARRRLPGSLLAIPALALGLLAGYVLWRSKPATAPSFHRLTYRRGVINGARFVADGQTAVYSSDWEGGGSGFFSKRLDNTGAMRLDMKSGSIIAAMSPSGEMLVLHDLRRSVGYARVGTLARAPVSGGSARDLLEDVSSADLAPDGQTMAVVLAPNWRYHLEFPAGKTLYETSGWIGQVRVSPRGDEVAILDHPQFGDDRGAVSLIDRAGKRTVLSDGWSSAQGIAWSPDGNEIWFTASDVGSDRRLWAVSRSGKRRFVAASPGEMTLMDISKAGQALFLHGRQQIGVLALAAGETRERDLSAMDWTRAPILSNDGKTTVFSEEGEGGGAGYSVFSAKTDGSSMPTRLGEGEAMAISSDGKWVLAGLVRLTPIELVLLPTGAGEPVRLKTAGLNVESFGSFLPGDRKIVFVASAPGHQRRAFELDLSGGDPKPVSPEGMPAGRPSPDGKQLIVFQQGKPPALISREDGAIHPIPGAEPPDYPLAWSSDGRSLFVRPRRPDDDSRLADRVVRLDLATGRRETWRDTRPADTSAMTSANVSAITPDGKTLAFTYARNNNDLYAVDGWK